MAALSILIIDENQAVRRLLTRRLNTLPGLSVVGETANPLEGTELARNLRPDVILADLKRRGAYSLEMYKRIARASRRSRLVIFTSYTDAAERAAFQDAGIDLCLLKGIALPELVGELRNLVDRKHGAIAAR